jgi:hypothetical protein
LLGVIEDKRKPPEAGTLGALAVSYYRSPAFHALRPISKNAYRKYIEIIREQHGHRSLRAMTRQGIIDKILMPFVDRPGRCRELLKILRVLIHHGITTQLLDRDPSLGIERPKLQEIRTWTDAEIEQFEASWPIGTRTPDAAHLPNDFKHGQWRAIHR